MQHVTELLHESVQSLLIVVVYARVFEVLGHVDPVRIEQQAVANAVNLDKGFRGYRSHCLDLKVFSSFLCFFGLNDSTTHLAGLDEGVPVTIDGGDKSPLRIHNLCLVVWV